MDYILRSISGTAVASMLVGVVLVTVLFARSQEVRGPGCYFYSLFYVVFGVMTTVFLFVWGRLCAVAALYLTPDTTSAFVLFLALWLGAGGGIVAFAYRRQLS